MESTGRFLEAGLVELNGVGRERGQGGMARGWKPKGELGGGYFDNQLVITGAWEESSQLLA